MAESTSSSPMLAVRSIWAKSPVFAGRSTVTSVPKRVRRFCSSSSISSSDTSTASTVSSYEE